ncbi:hypothetical protein ABBQ32_003912 [Trebouxia sp. C0010 RCD-2024]
MRDLTAAENKQLATTGSQKKSKTKKKKAAKQRAQESHDGCRMPDETAAEMSGYVELAHKVTLGQA